MSAPKSPAAVTYGCGLPVANVDEAKKLYDVVARHPQVQALDTARLYKDSERWIGELGLAKKYRMTTKAPTFTGRLGSSLEEQNEYSETVGTSKGKETILESAKQSFSMLGVDRVAVYLLHAPDTTTPFEEQMEAVQELYLQGRFERFGVSNYSAAQVKEIHNIAKVKGYVLPTVYQGSYSLILRTVESSLFPTLRSLNISFQAYSPIAGGFLATRPELISHPLGGGRWDPTNWFGALYQSKYNRPELVKYLEQFIELSKESGIGQAEIACRWARYHSILDGNRGDTVIVGSRKPEQLERTLTGIEQGPLDEEIVRRLDMMWEQVKDAAPTHEYVLEHLS